MSHTPHELHEEFPEFADRLHALKVGDAHFAKLADEYHEINRTIHRAETDIEPLDDLLEGELRKRRLLLKDQIGALLRG